MTSRQETAKEKYIERRERKTENGQTEKRT